MSLNYKSTKIYHFNYRLTESRVKNQKYIRLYDIPKKMSYIYDGTQLLHTESYRFLHGIYNFELKTFPRTLALYLMTSECITIALCLSFFHERTS